jgi:hypothetical protein
MTGYAGRPSAGPRRLSITARDEIKFPEYFALNPRARPVGPQTMSVVVEPLRYTGQSEILPTSPTSRRHSPASVSPRRFCRRTLQARSNTGWRTNAIKPTKNSCSR